MDSSSAPDATKRDHLLYYNGSAYRFLLLGDAKASCYHPLKLGSGELWRGFFEAIARDPAMRHRLWLEALFYAARLGVGGVGHDPVAWLTEQAST